MEITTLSDGAGLASAIDTPANGLTAPPPSTSCPLTVPEITGGTALGMADTLVV